MSWTKRQFVEEAYDEIGYSSDVYDLSPENLQKGLRRLDGMMAQWNGRGIRLGYPLPSSPEASSLDTETNVPDAANEAIYFNLAIRIAPGLGKVVTRETKVTARRAFNELIARNVDPTEMQYPGTFPRGSGNKPYRYYGGEYFRAPVEPLAAGRDGELEFD